MRQLTEAELREADSTVIIPAATWDALPRRVTDLLYGYIGRPGRVGDTPAYRFDNVPAYLQRQLLAEWEAWKKGN